MTNARQKRARLTGRGLARFEVLGRDCDRALIRSLARRLSEEGPDATRLRQTVSQIVAKKPSGAEPSRKGGVLAALRNSLLVGADLDLEKTRHPGRDLDL